MTINDAELFAEVQQRATENLIDLNLALMASVSGMGNHQLGRAQRIARFVDYADRGVLDQLQRIGAPAYGTLVREYMHDISASPLVEVQ